MLVRAGHAYQAATDWHRQHPVAVNRLEAGTCRVLVLLTPFTLTSATASRAPQ
jgi:hypothetical protein